MVIFSTTKGRYFQMALNVHKLDRGRHRSFLLEGRKDPITGENLKAGDKVIFCKSSQHAFLEESWMAIRGKGCNKKDCNCPKNETLTTFPTQSHSTERLKIKRATDFESQVYANTSEGVEISTRGSRFTTLGESDNYNTNKPFNKKLILTLIIIIVFTFQILTLYYKNNAPKKKDLIIQASSSKERIPSKISDNTKSGKKALPDVSLLSEKRDKNLEKAYNQSNNSMSIDKNINKINKKKIENSQPKYILYKQNQPQDQTTEKNSQKSAWANSLKDTKVKGGKTK